MHETTHLSLAVALEALASRPIPILAGGTDFYPALQDNPAPAHVLDTTRISELRTITETEHGWTIGAGSTWSDIIKAPLPPVYNALKAAAHEVGSVQIQNAATLAGNLCNASPAADGVPPLLALDASVELASSGGRRILPLAEFILGPRATARRADELLIAIHVPALPANAQSQFGKLGARRYLVISIAMASVVLIADNDGLLSDVRIAVGACSAVARRLPALEQVLSGESIDADLSSLINASMFSALSPMDDVRGSATYRLQAAQEMVSRLIMACARTSSGESR